MDFDLDDLISSDAVNHAKTSKKFQPKPKPKPKPKPIPETQSEPKSTPTPSTQFVEVAAATANNELTEEEQPENVVNQFPKDKCEYVGLNPSYDAVNSSARSETPTIYVSTNVTLKGLAEPDLNNNSDACINLKGLDQVDPLTGEEAAIVNENDHFDIENSSMQSKEAETSPFWEPLDILSRSKIISGPKFGKLKPKPKAQSRIVEQIVNPSDQDVMSFQYEDNILSDTSQTNFMENKCVPSFASEKILDSSSIRVTDSVPNETISDYHVNEEPICLAKISQVDSVHQDDAFSVGLKRQLNKTLELIEESVDEGIDHDIMHRTEFDNNDGDYGPETESLSERKRNNSKKPVTEKKKAFRKRKKASDEGIDHDIIHRTEFDNNAGDYGPETESLSEIKRNNSKKPVTEKKKAFRKRKKASEEGIDHDTIHRTECDNNDGDYGPETESLIERKGNKSMKPVTEKKTAFRKRKKASEKFSHSTRRNKIKVNPEFLNIPEDELELHMQNVPIKERVRLAMHREWIAKKEASIARTPAIKQSVGSFTDYYDEQEALAQGRGSANEHEFSREAHDAQCYNYRTHMKIKPRTKWLAQDTEDFYKALQLFGENYAMIAGCLPGRTREQIKSKFKKEERQQPLRLNDATFTRAKDHAVLEVLIEQQAQAQDSENDDDPMTLADSEDEVVATDTNEKTDETKPVVGKEIKDAEYDVSTAVAETPTKSDSEDDMYRWGEYKSEL